MSSYHHVTISSYHHIIIPYHRSIIWSYDHHHIIISSYHGNQRCPKNPPATFRRIQTNVLGNVGFVKDFDINPGTIGWIRQKVVCNFSKCQRLKNREDGSDFDDSWTKSIVTTRSSFLKDLGAVKKVFVEPIRTEISARPIRDRRPDQTGSRYRSDGPDEDRYLILRLTN